MELSQLTTPKATFDISSLSSSVKPLRCPICSWKVTSSLELHLQSHMEIKPYKCSLPGCKFQTKFKQNWERHETVHSKGKRFACDLCSNYRATTKYTVLKHKRNCHGQISSSLLTSNINPSHSSSFTSSNNRKVNLGSSSHGKRGHSHGCKIKIPKGKKMDLNQRRNHHHHEQHHQQQQQPLAQVGGKARCPVCSWNIKTNFEKHLQSHLEQKPFKCSYSGCQFSTRHKQNLDRHEIVHTKEKRYSCELCEYRATTRYTVVKHMKSCHAIDNNLSATPTTNNSHHKGSHHNNNNTNNNHSLLTNNLSSSSSRVHSDRSFKCPEFLCKYVGKSEAHLSRHLSMKAHTTTATTNHQQHQPDKNHHHHQIAATNSINTLNTLNNVNIQAAVNSIIPGILPGTLQGRGGVGGVDPGTFAGFSTAAATLCNVPYYYPYNVSVGKPYG